MAKKTTSKTTKKTAKKTTKKVAKKVAKKTTKKVTKTAAKKSTTKKTPQKTTKKVTKPASKKAGTASSKKKVVKKTATKKAAPKTTKKVAKAPSKTPAKKAPAKPVAKKTTKKVAKTSPAKKAASSKSTAKPTAKSGAKSTAKPAGGKPGAKEGENKPPVKKFRARSRKRVPADYAPPPRPLLLGPGTKLSSGPLISSSKRPKKSPAEQKVSKRTKTPFTAKQLDDYKLTLLKKRAELVGDVNHLEDEALRSNTGTTQTASNAAEFGTESFEQGLNLNLAAADRLLIIEIDEALSRIADRTYGLCIESHEPIKKERLAELPWAKFSITTARKHDQHYRR